MDGLDYSHLQTILKRKCMLPKKFFYIITRDGQIFEIKYDENVLMATAKTMQDKGLITLKEYGVILNGVDISKVLSADQYDNYLSSVKPKEYIKNGVWRDGKEHGVIRYASWKEEELKGMETERIAPVRTDTRMVKGLLQKYKPEFVKPYKDD